MRQRPRTSSLSANTTPIGQPTTEGRLRGRGLLWARIGFILLVGVVLTLNAITLPSVLVAQIPPDAAQYLHHFSILSVVVVSITVFFSYGDMLVFLVIGLVLFWRRSDNRMALFCAAMLVLTGGISFSNVDGLINSALPAPIGDVPWLVVAVNLLAAVGQVASVTFFLVFPSGRFVPRWTLWCVPAAAVYWLAALVFPGLVNGPVGMLTVVFLAIAAMAQVYRYRRVSTAVEREQTKWVVFGIFLAAAIIAVPQVIITFLPVSLQQFAQSNQTAQDIIGLRWEIALMLLPVSIAVAISRSRLWAIDTLINRTLVYGSLTAILAAVYFGCVIGAQALAQSLTGVPSLPPIAIVASTLLIAALFTPLRRGIQTVIDRRFYRRKYDAAKTLAAFSATLRQEVDLEALSAHVVRVVRETMQPESVSLWLQSPKQKTEVDAGSATIDRSAR